MEANLD